MTTRDEQDARYWPTRAGLVAAICAAAEPFTVGCPVTVYRPRTKDGYPKCGEPIVSDGLCARHLADKERLS